MLERWPLIGLLLILLVLTVAATWSATDEGASHQIKNPYEIDDYRSHPCKRTCRKDEPPMTCHYYFLLEHYTTMSTACYDCPTNQSDCFLPQCVPGDGSARGILSVNRMLPGPTIAVCKGDTIVVLVDNRMELGEGTSIHWHGVRQVGSPYMDGTNLVTQCPIHSGAKMEYRFKAGDAGTHFYHSHSFIQRSDGLFGGLVVRAPVDLDPHRHLYDYDLTEHTILLIDWTKKISAEAFPQDFHDGIRSEPASVLINGFAVTEDGPSIPRPVFTVKANKRYRFRIINNGIYNCPILITIDKHPLLMVATDGRNFEPVDVDAFVIFSGERYDFIVNTKHGIKKNFWIRFKGNGRCTGTVFQTAILRYEGAEDSEPDVIATPEGTQERDDWRVLNGLSGVSTNKTIQVVDLRAVDEGEEQMDVLTKKPNKQFYITLGASEFLDDRFKPPPLNVSTDKPPPVRPVNHQFNYIASQLPPSPPLTQFKDIPKDLFCNNETTKYDCSQKFCRCVHLLTFDLGDVVEIVMVSFKNTLIHPIHMHGHSFRVLAMQKFGRDLTVKEIKALDKKGHIPRRRSHAPFKDTIPVGAQSVVIIRIKAYNPGFWLFHCHIEFHTELGMLLILQSGKPHEMPQPPEGFPTCGDWRPGRNQLGNIAKTQGTAGEQSNERRKSSVGILVGATGAVAVVIVVLFVVFHRRRGSRQHMLYTRVSESDIDNYHTLK